MKLVIFYLFALSSLSLYSQGGEFDYNHDIMVRYAIVALEELHDKRSSYSQKLSERFRLTEPISYGKEFPDCKGQKRRVILVAFPSFDNEGHASVYMIYSRDNFFERFLSRGETLGSADEMIKSFAEAPYEDFLFGCGV